MVTGQPPPNLHATRRHPDIRIILTLAVPLILTNFAHVALTTIDVIVLGALGTLEVAAGGLAIALFNQLRTTGTGLVTGVSNLIAEAHAQGQPQRIPALVAAGLFWATMSGLLFIALLLMAKTPLVHLGQDPDVVEKALQFLLVASPGLLPCLWFQTLRHVTVGLKQPGPLLAITLISIALSAGLNYVLVFGKLGLSPMGLKGVALATSIVFLISFLMFLAVVLRNQKLAPYFRWSSLKLSSDTIMTVWKLGLPIAGTYASEAGFFSVLTLLTGTLGQDALAAQTVLNQIIYIVFMISSGISHAASINISEACGSRDYSRARRLGKTGIGLGAAAMLLVAIPYILWPTTIVSWFISADEDFNATAISLAASGLLIAISCRTKP